ncbi:MAG: DUF1579 domain-containing protein [Thermoanaerobaculia bacterium]
MKRNVSLLVALVLVCSFPAFAQTEKDDMQKMMAAMASAAAPGPQHKLLDGFVGTWDAKVTMWPAPGAEPMVSTGKSEHKWVMGGRFLEQRFKSSFMGQPFEGLGYAGYDNVKKQHWGVWMDNTTTGVMMTTGPDSDGKSFKSSGSYADPMTGKDAAIEEVISVDGPDQLTMSMFGPGPDGKTYKTMEIVYTRSKK